MTEHEYRTHPAISRSELWKISESPEKFRYYKDNPQPSTPALLFGQVAHKLLLEPDDFDSEFAVAPNVDKRTKAGKEVYAQFCADNADKTIVSQDDYLLASEMAAKVLSTPLCADLLNGQHEVPYFWTDSETNEQCKCRVDCLTETDGGLVIIDYKTAASAATDKFNTEIFRYGYHFQAAMYSEGVMQALGLSERPDFAFIAQEKKPPYSVNVIAITDDVMLAGLDVYRELLGIYHDCKETDWWYGYLGAFDVINEAYLPGYMSLGDRDGEGDEG